MPRLTIKRGKGFWYINTVRPSLGGRIRRRFSDALYGGAEAARAAAQDFVADLDQGSRRPTIQSTFEEAAHAYLRWCEITGKKRHSTIRSDRGRLTIVDRWLAAKRISAIGDITVQTIRDFQDAFFDGATWYRDGRSRPHTNRNKTWNQYRLILNALFEWCLERGYMESNPIGDRKEFRVKQPKSPSPEVYTPEEVQKLFEYFDNWGNDHVATFFRLLAYTGMRLGEAMSLKWKDVDIDNRVMILQPSDTKNAEGRVLVIHDALLPWLQRLPKDTVLVFGRPEGSRLRSGDAWYKLWITAQKRCGIPRRRLHDIRHTVGTLLTDCGVAEKETGRILGHKDPRSTKIYLHTSTERLAKAIKKLPY